MVATPLVSPLKQKIASNLFYSVEFDIVSVAKRVWDLFANRENISHLPASRRPTCVIGSRRWVEITLTSVFLGHSGNFPHYFEGHKRTVYNRNWWLFCFCPDWKLEITKRQRFLPESKNEETLIHVNRSRGKTTSFNRRVSACYPKPVFFHSSLSWKHRCPSIALNNPDVATSSNSRWSENGLN